MATIKTHRVLIVDDDEALAMMIRLSLARAGYDAEAAFDGFEALEKMHTSPPYDVMLIDLIMPDMDGLQLLAKARKLDPNVQAIMITAAATVDSAIESLRDGGAYDYLLKPFENMKQLSLVVDRAVAHRQMQLEAAALQAELVAQAQRLQALIRNTGDAIVMADSQGMLNGINPVAQALFGESVMEGRPALDYLPKPVAKLIVNWLEIDANLPALVEVAWPEKHTQMASLTPLTDQDGRGWILILRDVTHHKQMDELKAQALHEVASKIRMPMAKAMSTLAELNRYAVKEPGIADIVYQLSKTWSDIQSWGDSLAQIVQVYSSPEVSISHFDLSGVLAEIEKDLLSQAAEDHGVQVVMSVEPELSRAVADRAMLKRLLEILIQRSIFRCEDSGQIYISARSNRNQVWIAIRDQGPPLFLGGTSRLYDLASVQLQNNLDIELELAMVGALIKRMDGQIWVRDAGSEGSTITICLPAAG